MTKQDLLKLLEPYGQQHLVRYWDELDRHQQARLAQEINEIDFELLLQLTQDNCVEEDWGALAARSTPPAAVRLPPGEDKWKSDRDEAREAGQEALRQGRVGVVLVAGGQGSRLGFPHPKGMYPLGPVSGRTLFQIHVDRLLSIGARYGVAIPLYLMTSPATHAETRRYFQENGRLGLAADQLIVFSQGTMPAVDARTGRLLLCGPGTIALSPDGHGGMVAALAKNGCLADMRRRGIEQLFYFQVDNPLAAVADPWFVGHHLLAGSEMTTQVVQKQDPLEKLGNVISVDGHLRIIEYSDLPADAARQRNEHGQLVIWAGSIAVHMFDRGFLERSAESLDVLPFHRARKCVPYIDARGELISPHEPNAIKFERFIFDLLPSARNALVVEVDPREAFAPLKNAPGAAADTPATAQAAMAAQHARWLREAGVTVHPEVTVEINPRFALDVPELRQKIAPGHTCTQDTYFG